MTEKPTDLNRFREEKIQGFKIAVLNQIRQFLLAEGVTNMVVEWDDTSNYKKLRLTIRDVESNKIVLTGTQFHRDLLDCLSYSSASELEEYEVNPYGEPGYITFDKL